ncbi:MAG: YebC/PmpR family DNA-binding transcriptional regulator [Candidatus Magasanikbacteria bacterium]|nr:YebC/PmpR family DNA-binding transcriptional regulator [Candidatus Magasanikbacteria bacterium]
MSGHSKWATIKRAKGATDVKRGQQFTKLARGIAIAAREGGGDPVTNFKLRLSIDKARSFNMPKDGIDRAIAHGTGKDKAAAIIEEGLYEGFGPGKVGVLVAVATDNKNRTAGDIKQIFSKNNGAIAGPGSVKWQFGQNGVIRLSGMLDEAQELALIDAGADDIRKEAEGTTVYTAVPNFRVVSDAVAKLGFTPADSGLEWIPKDTVAIDDATRAQLEKLFEALDEHDDVQDFYSNEV